MQAFLRELWWFGIKQAWACLFGALLLAAILVTAFWYPFTSLARYDFLFLYAIGIQVLLLSLRLESPREAVVILVFHVVATIMELFKTSTAIGSWHYPESYQIGIAGVPLFAGFMYSAVGSYIARISRLLDFRFSHYPPMWTTVVLVMLIYANFFTHHYTIDLRWGLVLATFVMFGRCQVYFRPKDVYHHMSLVVGWFLVAFFIWIAENLGTFGGIWLYPDQSESWRMVSASKLNAWYLLMLLSFVLVTLVHPPRHFAGGAVESGGSENNDADN